MVLYTLDAFVKTHGDDTQDQDAGDHQIELEYLAAVDNQVSKTLPGSQKFSDDDAHQCQADIDFRSAEHDGDGAGQDYFAEGIALTAPQSVDLGGRRSIHLLKAGVEADNGTEQGNGDSRHHNGGAARAQPHDEERSQGGFGQTVQNHQVRFGDFGQLLGIPQQRGGKQADQEHQQETDDGFQQGNAHMHKQGAVQYHPPKAFGHQAGAGEKEAVDPVQPGADFPQGQEQQEKKDAVKGNLVMMPPVLPYKRLLFCQFFFMLAHVLISSHNSLKYSLNSGALRAARGESS